MNHTHTFFLFLVLFFNSALFAGQPPLSQSRALLIPRELTEPAETHSYESRSIVYTNSNSTEISRESSSSTSPKRKAFLESAASAVMQVLTETAQKTVIKENRVELLKSVATKLQIIIFEEEVKERVREELEKEKIRILLIEEAQKATAIAMKSTFFSWPGASGKACALEEVISAEIAARHVWKQDCP